MKPFIEHLLGNDNAMAIRRTSSRVNSLLFEEDSMMIKREMMR